jgi:hypothetical protein
VLFQCFPDIEELEIVGLALDRLFILAQLNLLLLLKSRSRALALSRRGAVSFFSLRASDDSAVL